MEQQLMMEIQMEMMTSMFKACIPNAIDARHKPAELSSSEQNALKNCFIKYANCPEHVMGGLEHAKGHGF